MKIHLNMVSYRDIVSGLKHLGLDPARPVIVHASLSAFGDVQGGAETILGALMAVVDALIMPTFTYRTMVIPEEGPEHNGITYGSGRDLNRMAEIFVPSMPADPLMGVIAETLRKYPGSSRSRHPILSFSGVNSERSLQLQSMQDPLAPIADITEQGGWVLLMGVDHTVNTSIHYAEKLSGRKQFIRWALSPQGVLECPGYPGCSDGFEQAAPQLSEITRQVNIGEATVKALPLQEMCTILTQMLLDDPLALLCSRPDCERCADVRYSVAQPRKGHV
ncbi:MAG: AAC(3) family N-acetyltransferase [Anaerolineae bacterium]|nr:AAC(3) family N-acetyltransferase [Anaerolineae bacterium]